MVGGKQAAAVVGVDSVVARGAHGLPRGFSRHGEI